MLGSSEEDKILALTNINNLDQKANVIPILFLRKECTRTNLELWKEHANKSIKYQRTLGVDDSNNVIKYKNILAAINKQKVKKESNIEFFCRRFEVFSYHIQSFYYRTICRWQHTHYFACFTFIVSSQHLYSVALLHVQFCFGYFFLCHLL